MLSFLIKSVALRTGFLHYRLNVRQNRPLGDTDPCDAAHD